MPSCSRLAALFAAAALVALAPAAGRAADAGLEAKFDGLIDPAEMGGWLKTMSAQPNHVGSAHDKANAEMTLAQFRSWGWDARIETFWVLYPTPKEVALELVSGAGAPFKATLSEGPVPGDETSTRTADELPAYVAFQGDGDVTAPLVYVNYGMPADYEALERLGVSVKGKIVIARYGMGWRGLKPKLAQDHGAVGAIIYSDPRDDGYATGDAYPKGPARPPQGFQRGSVADMPLYPGDPLTPGIGATKDAKRLSRAEATTILKIPALPIAYADAQVLLAALDGHEAAAPVAARTIPFQPAAGAADPERTVVQAASPGPDPSATQPAGNALGAAVPASALPGYDAAHDGLTRGAQFDKTSVMNKSGAPGMPQAGGGKSGQEP